jgi:RNase P/RNase MRP subunit p29
MRDSLPCRIEPARDGREEGEMERTPKTLGLLCGAMLLASSATAAEMKTYQVTGPVVSVTSDSIVVKKGKDDWTIAKDASTKGPEVKPGDKVTIKYKMTATDIELKKK